MTEAMTAACLSDQVMEGWLVPLAADTACSDMCAQGG